MFPFPSSLSFVLSGRYQRSSWLCVGVPLSQERYGIPCWGLNVCIQSSLPFPSYAQAGIPAPQGCVGYTPESGAV